MLARTLIVALCSLLLLTSCDDPDSGLFVSYSVGLLSVSLNDNGNVSFEVGHDFTLPSFLGTFRVGYHQDAARELNVPNVLIIRCNGQDRIFDLHGENLQVSFQPGYYRQISLIVSGNNIVLELTRVGSTGSDYTVESRPSQACSGGLRPRLVIGRQGRVEPYNNISNRVRAGPGLNAEFLGLVGPGGVFDVLDGPTCGDGINWWRIRHGSLVGWMAEGQGREYYTEPW